jgi:DNA-directed RNA polymerase subunit RPC12/RpoP
MKTFVYKLPNPTQRSALEGSQRDQERRCPECRHRLIYPSVALWT